MEVVETPRRVILHNYLAPGDIVMLTGAVRDLHRCHPGEYIVDVRTRHPDLWTHNPHLTPLEENSPSLENVYCEYPLINHSNQRPAHFLQGFCAEINELVGCQITPTEFRGDIHLSDSEMDSRALEDDLRDLAGSYWIVSAGGKFDFTIKWWIQERFQKVIDHFKGTIPFVQIGAENDYHPPLRGVTDLRGRTSLRQLATLVFHSAGILSPVTLLMHLAAAVKTKSGLLRPCVVIAGGREPVHWESYPGHQFLHTIGALSCCAHGGCWKSRTNRLNDGSPLDNEEHLCKNLSGRYPKCMTMISSEEVIAAIWKFYEGGVLSPKQHYSH